MPLIGGSEKWLRMLIFQNLTFVLPAALLGKEEIRIFDAH